MNDAVIQTVVFNLIVAVVALFVGTALSVVIHRLPIMMDAEWLEAFKAGQRQEAETDLNPERFDIWHPRWRCPSCETALGWSQLFPLLSYLRSSGNCHHCNSKISVRYPAIELITMLMSLMVAWHFGPSPQAALGLIFTWYLIAMTVIDIDHHLLPDRLTLPLMWIGLLASSFSVFADVHASVIGAALGYLILLGINKLTLLTTGRESIGYGDLKLLAAIGAILGWQQLPVVIGLSFLFGAISGLVLIVIVRIDSKTHIPFGPYIAAAGWLSLLYGEEMIGFVRGFSG